MLYSVLSQALSFQRPCRKLFEDRYFRRWGVEGWWMLYHASTKQRPKKYQAITKKILSKYRAITKEYLANTKQILGNYLANTKQVPGELQQKKTKFLDSILPVWSQSG